MPISDEQRAARRKYIGSSDVAAILGKDPWRTAADVYISKVEELEDRPNEAMVAGTKLERTVVEWAADKLGAVLIPDQFRVSPKNELMSANHDALVKDKPWGVEAKTACVLHFAREIADQWGEPGSDEVPSHVLLQCQAQMFVSDLELVWVPVLIGGRGFQMYCVDRSEKLVEVIVNESTRFWEQHVAARIPPVGYAPSIDVVKAVRRQPKKVVPIRLELVDAWQEAKRKEKEAAEACERSLAILLAELGDAEAGECDDGVLTYMEQTRKSFVAKETTFRVPRFKAKSNG